MAKNNKLSLVLATVGLAFALTEISLWVLSKLSPRIEQLLLPHRIVERLLEDPKLKHVGNPEHPEHDARGFRNTYAMKQATVVALGDSQTYGSSVGPEHTWPVYFEKASGARTYSLSLPGWGPVRLLAFESTITSLKPKVVVHSIYYGNDLVDVFDYVYVRKQQTSLARARLTKGFSSLEEKSALVAEAESVFRKTFNIPPPEKNSSPQAPPSLIKNIRLVGLISALVGRVKTAEGPKETKVVPNQRGLSTFDEYTIAFKQDELQTLFTPSYRAYLMNTADPRIAEASRTLLRGIRHLRDAFSRASMEYVVLFIPTKELVFKEKIQQAGEVPSELARLYRLEEALWAKTEAYLEIERIDYINPLTPLREALNNDSWPYFTSSDGHPNALGNEILAQQVADHLKSLL